VLAAATLGLAMVLASRKNPNREKAARTSIELRVTSGLNPKIFQLSASQLNTRGGWAFEGVEYGISDPESRS